jgi:hypothetical protein
MKFLITLIVLLTSYISSKLLRHKTKELIRVNAKLNLQTEKKKITKQLKSMGEEVYIEFNDQMPVDGLHYMSLLIKSTTMNKKNVELIKTHLGLPEGNIDNNGNLILQIPLNKVVVGLAHLNPIQYKPKRINPEEEFTEVAEVGFNQFDPKGDYFQILLLNINKDKNIVEIRIQLHDVQNKEKILKWGKVHIYYNIADRIATYNNVLLGLNKYLKQIESNENPLKEGKRITLQDAVQTRVGNDYFCFNVYCLETFYSLTSTLGQELSFCINNVKRLITSYGQLVRKQNFYLETMTKGVFAMMKDDGDMITK